MDEGSYSRAICNRETMFAGVIKPKYAFFSSSQFCCCWRAVLPNTWAQSRKSLLGAPASFTIIRRGRSDVANVHKQWLNFKGPGQTGRQSESRSTADGWAVNHRTSANVRASGVCLCSNINAWLCIHTLIHRVDTRYYIVYTHVSAPRIYMLTYRVWANMLIYCVYTRRCTMYIHVDIPCMNMLIYCVHTRQCTMYIHVNIPCMNMLMHAVCIHVSYHVCTC